MTSSDRFPVPDRSAVESNLTDWCFQNLSKRALNALTLQASTTELGKLFQIFTMRAEKNAFKQSLATANAKLELGKHVYSTGRFPDRSFPPAYVATWLQRFMLSHYRGPVA